MPSISDWQMKPFAERTPDSQYQDRLRFILANGYWKETTVQGVAQIVCLELPPMVFDLKNGIPLINERKINFWRPAIGELCAFINGAQTQEELKKFGVSWWSKWVTSEKCSIFGLPPGDLGPGSYGPGFNDQWSKIVEQIKAKPYLATHEICPWIPNLITTGERKVVVAPCHGWAHFEVLGGELNMTMRQRSADFPVGVPANMIQYSAILLAIAKITGYVPGKFIHQFCNAHIYADQLPSVYEMIHREPRRLATMSLTNECPEDILSVRSSHFELDSYEPHPAISDIPVAT